MKKYIATVRTAECQDMEAFPLGASEQRERTVDYLNDIARYSFELAGVGLSAEQQQYLDALWQRGTPFLWSEVDATTSL